MLEGLSGWMRLGEVVVGARGGDLRAGGRCDARRRNDVLT